MLNLPPIICLSTSGDFEYQLEALEGQPPTQLGSVMQGLIGAASRGSGRVRFPRGPFEALLATMAALSCFVVAIGTLRFSERAVAIDIINVAMLYPVCDTAISFSESYGR